MSHMKTKKPLHNLFMMSSGLLISAIILNLFNFSSNTTYARRGAIQPTFCGFKTISTGFLHSIAIKSDGTVWTWGSNDNGQLGYDTNTPTNNPPNSAYSDVPVQVSGISNVRAVAAGRYASYAVESDGTVWAWGGNSNGQLGQDNGVLPNSPTPVQVPGLSGIITIAAGQSHVLALESGGNVWAWGADSNGELGDNNTLDEFTPAKVKTNNPDAMDPPLANIIAIGAGNAHSLAVDNSGNVWAWGQDNQSQLGDRQTSDESLPVKVQTQPNPDNTYLGNIVSVAGGQGHSMALDSSGNVWTWGSNFNSPSLNYKTGQLGYNTDTNTSSFAQQVTGVSSIIQISAGRFHSEALDDTGNVWTWGANDTGQLGNGSSDQNEHDTPAQVSGLSNITAIAAGRYHTLAYNGTGASTFFSWGQNNVGQLGNRTTTNQSSATSPIFPTSCITPNHGPAAGGTNVTISGTNFETGISVKFDGLDATNIVIAPDNNSLTADTPAHAAGTVDVMVTNSGFPPTSATEMQSFTYDSGGGGGGGGGSNCGFTTIATSFLHNLAVKADGTVWSWGANEHGQLGYDTGGNNYSITPTQISGLSNITAVATGRYHSLALDSNGDVWAWGSNTSSYNGSRVGQLGNADSSEADSTTPIDITTINSLPRMTAIAAGQDFSMSLDASGNVWAWGSNISGQLGIGSSDSSDHNTPVQISGFPGAVTAIGAGNQHALAVSGGNVWAWGQDSQGQLGDYHTNDQSSPVKVQTQRNPDNTYLHNIVSVAGGQAHSLALDSFGNVWAWGSNYNNSLGFKTGQLGYTTDGNYSNFAKEVNGVTNITAIAAGRFHSEALDDTGNVWTWGTNDAGQLGNGSNDNNEHNTPAQVSGLSNITAIAAGRYHTMALNNSGSSTLSAWGSNSKGLGGSLAGQLGTGTGDTADHSTPVQVSYSFTCSGGGGGGSPPDAPALNNPTAGDSQVALDWSTPNDNGSPITSYKVVYGPIGCNVFPYDNGSTPANCTIFDSLTTLTPLSTHTTITGLTNGTDYIFAVYALNANGISPHSNTVDATPSATPNCPGIVNINGQTGASCDVTTITGGDLSFTAIPDNTAFASAQNNTSLPSFNNAGGTDSHDVMSVSDLRDDPAAGYEVQIEASTPFATADTLNDIPLQYLYVASTVPRTAGAHEDPTKGSEYATGCSGPVDDVTGSVNADSPSGPPDLGSLTTFTGSGSNLGSGNTTTPVVLMSAPAAARRCTISQAISYAVDLPTYRAALGSNIPAGTYSVTFTYTLIPNSGSGGPNPDIHVNKYSYSEASTSPIDPNDTSSTTAQGPTAIDVQNNFAYIVNQTNPKLSIYDVTVPESPVLKTTNPLVLPASATDIKVLDNPYGDNHNYAYIGTTSSLVIVDVTDPTNPQITDTIDLTSNGGGITRMALLPEHADPSKLYAYATQSANNSFSIIDVSNPTNATPTITTTNVGSQPSGITAAYYTGTGSGEFSGETEIPSEAGDYVYFINKGDNNIEIFNVTNPLLPTAAAAPYSLGTNGNGDPGCAPTDLTFVNAIDLIEVPCSGHNNTWIVDVFDPANPTIPGSYYYGSTGNLGNIVHSNYYQTFTPDNSNGDIVGGYFPLKLTQHGTPAYKYLAISGGYLYATNFNDNSFSAIDISTVAYSPDENHVKEGQNIHYVLWAVNNSSATDAHNVVLSDTMPANTSIVSITSLTGSCTTLPCNIGTFPANGQEKIDVVATVNNECPTMTNTATISSSDTALYPSQTTSSVTTNIVGGTGCSGPSNPDISVNKYSYSEASTSPIDPNDTSSTTAQGPTAIDVQGNFAYIVNQTNPKLSIYDITVPESPILQTTNPLVLPASATDIKVLDNPYGDNHNYAYIGTSNSLVVVDVTDPTNPQITATIDLTSSGGGITRLALLSEHVNSSKLYAYATQSANNSFSIIDVSNPTNATPTITTTNVGSQPSGITAAYYTGTGSGEIPGEAGDYVYFTNQGDNNLEIFNVTNPLLPTAASAPISVESNGNVDTYCSPTDLTFVSAIDEIEIPCSGDANIWAINVIDPVNPRVTSARAFGSSGYLGNIVHDITNESYLPDSNGDIKGDSSFPILSQHGTPAYKYLAISGNYFYATNFNDNSFTAINVSNISTTGPIASNVKEGQNIHYVLSAYNISSTTAANNVVLSDPMPANTSIVSITPEIGSCSTLPCNIGTLAPLAQEQIDVLATVNNECATMTNTATIATSDTDTNLSNNTSNVNTTIVGGTGCSAPTDLSLAKYSYSESPPTPLDPSDSSVQGPTAIDVKGNYAYIVNDTNPKLTIYDVSTPETPVFKTNLSLPAAGTDIKVFINPYGDNKNYAYVGTASSLIIVDVTDPTNPTIAGSGSGVVDLSGGGVTRLTLFNNTANNSTYPGTYLYATQKSNNSVAVINVSDPAAPSLITTISGLNQPTGIVAGHHSLICTADHPCNGSQFGEEDANPGDYIYFTNAGGGNGNGTLQIYNIDNPSLPTLASNYQLPVVGCNPVDLGPVGDAGGQGDQTWISCSGEVAFPAIFLPDPTTPSVAGLDDVGTPTTTEGWNDWGHLGNMVSDDNGNWYVDSDNNTIHGRYLPLLTFELTPHDNGASPKNKYLASSGNYLYATNYNDNSFSAINVSLAGQSRVQQGQPIKYILEVDNYSGTPAQNVTLSDTMPANTTITNIELSQGSCTDPTDLSSCNLGTVNPFYAFATITATANNPGPTMTNNASVSTTDTDGNPGNNSASLDTTIVPNGDSNLSLFGRSSSLASSTPTTDPIGENGIGILNNNAFVTETQGNNLIVYDLSDHANPSIINTTTTAYAPGAIKVLGNYAYIAGTNGSNQLMIYDISTPSTPVYKGHVSVGTDPISVDVLNNGADENVYAYVANKTSADISIVNVTDPTNPTVVNTYSTASLLQATYTNPSIGGIAVGHHIGTNPGDYAYFTFTATSTSSSPDQSDFYVLNINDPTNPSLVSNWDFVPNFGLPHAYDIKLYKNGNNDANLIAVGNSNFNEGSAEEVISIADPTNLGPVELAGGVFFGRDAKGNQRIGIDNILGDKNIFFGNLSNGSNRVPYLEDETGDTADYLGDNSVINVDPTDAISILNSDLIFSDGVNLNVLNMSSAGQSIAYKGHDITYTINGINRGAPSNNVTINQTYLPANTTFVTAYDVINGVTGSPCGLPCNLGTIGHFQSYWVNVTLHVDPAYPDPTLTDTFTITGDATDSDPSNNTFTMTSDVQ